MAVFGCLFVLSAVATISLGLWPARLHFSAGLTRWVATAFSAGVSLGGLAGMLSIRRSRRATRDTAREDLLAFCPACASETTAPAVYCPLCTFPLHQQTTGWVEQGGGARGDLFAFLLFCGLAGLGYLIVGFQSEGGLVGKLLPLIGVALFLLFVFLSGLAVLRFFSVIADKRVFEFVGNATAPGASIQAKASARFRRNRLTRAEGETTLTGAVVFHGAVDDSSPRDVRSFARIVSMMVAAGGANVWGRRVATWRIGVDDEGDFATTCDVVAPLFEIQVYRDAIPSDSTRAAVVELHAFLPEAAFRRAPLVDLWSALRDRPDTELCLRRIASLLPLELESAPQAQLEAALVASLPRS